MLNKHSITGTGLLMLAAPSLLSQVKPNIIFIMADDHATAAISAYNSRLASVFSTPNLDRLASQGVRFESCFATNSISTPSRAAILTGKYSNKNGVYTLSDRLDTSLVTVAKLLHNNGYKTAIVGKWHLVTEPRGFDDYACFIGQGTYHNPSLIEKNRTDNLLFEESKGTKYEGHSTDVVTSRAIKWLDEQKDDGKPFFLMCHFKAPHRPWQPASRFSTLLDTVTIPEPSNLFDNYFTRGRYTDTLEMSLEYMTETDLKQPVPTGLPRDEHRRWAYQIYLKDYLRCIAGIDENVGKLLSYLKDNNLDSNTIVIYTSDQGFFLGEHGWFDKRLMQEESIKMPFIIRYPSEINPGGINRDLSLNVDFAPTLLDFAGVSIPEDMQGKSFRNNINHTRTKGWRKSIYYRYWMHNDFWHRSVANLGIRTDRYKLIFYYGAPLDMKGAREPSLTPEWELYDLKKDPAEMNNVYGDPRYKRVIKKLKMEILKQRHDLGDEDNNRPVMKEIMNEYFWK
jgi:arylsulfatase A-like enzyme